MTTCSRRNCDKKLNSNNKKGVCGSGCRSPDAPLAHQAKGVEAASKQVEKQEVTGTAIARFRAVHAVMGTDADAVLEEFATTWLDGIRQALES